MIKGLATRGKYLPWIIIRDGEQTHQSIRGRMVKSSRKEHAEEVERAKALNSYWGVNGDYHSFGGSKVHGFSNWHSGVLLTI